MLEPIRPIDTRRLFRPVSRGLVALLRDAAGRRLGPADHRGRVARARRRRPSARLDAAPARVPSRWHDAPAPSQALASERDFVGFINELNAQWVTAAKRLSPRVLTDLYDRASGEAADWFEALPLDAPALFAVSWAGEDASAGWFDIGREFTELWHHQAQIRLAVDAAAARRSAVPRGRARRRGARPAARVPGRPGRAAATRSRWTIEGASGGRWTLSREAARWTLWRGEPDAPVTRAPPERRDGVAAPVQRAVGPRRGRRGPRRGPRRPRPRLPARAIGDRRTSRRRVGPSRSGYADRHLLNRVVAVAQAIPFGALGLGATGKIGGAGPQGEGPVCSTRVISSHHCQLWRWRSLTRRASCQPPPLTLTSTRAIGAAPDQATPRMASSPGRTSVCGVGSVIKARTRCSVTGSRTMSAVAAPIRTSTCRPGSGRRTAGR